MFVVRFHKIVHISAEPCVRILKTESYLYRLLFTYVGRLIFVKTIAPTSIKKSKYILTTIFLISQPCELIKYYDIHVLFLIF